MYVICLVVGDSFHLWKDGELSQLELRNLPTLLLSQSACQPPKGRRIRFAPSEGSGDQGSRLRKGQFNKEARA